MSALPSHHPRYRTKLCRNFASGDCPFGQKCSFLHPAPGINPSALLAQNLSNWNALLPQLLALSSQQGALEKMPRRWPPRPQGPRLIGEGPSPSSSLLLSRSDSTSSEHISETRQSSTRKRYPCRHFLRTGGWCPAGAKCRFYHDVAALPSTSVRQAKPIETDAHGAEGRTISGGVLMEPNMCANVEPARPYPPPYWPNYAWQPYQPYYTTVPSVTAVPIPVTTAPASVVQHGIHPPLQPQVQPVPPGETEAGLPLGAYELDGTTYFPTSMPSDPAPAPATYSIPVQSAPYGHPMAPAYPYYAPPTLSGSYYGVLDQTSNIRHQSSFDPFASDRVMSNELPVIPRLEGYQMSPVQQDALPPPLSPSSALTSNLAPITAKAQSTVTKDSDHGFPYRPPRNQRVGHTRRISVNIKKEGRANSD